MGKVIGGVVGGALGLSGGMPLGMVISSLLFPGIGPVVAIGFMTAAIAGSIGAAGGAAAGGALEYSLTEGLPRDELYFYEDALRQGRTILILRTDDDQQLETGRKILTAAGAESIDAAREKWWIGLRDAEAESYDPSERSENFLKIESNYRKGFEAALDPSNRSKRYAEAQNDLKTRFPSLWDTPEFRAGYERGHEHAQNRLGRSEISSSART